MVWKPHVTVAAVVERDGELLLVQERAAGQRVINQPGGHLEDGETLLQAIRREVAEETGWQFQPEAVVGIYRWRNPDDGVTQLRVCFCGSLGEHDPGLPPDPSIIAALWLSPDQLRRRAPQLRSPLVLKCLDDFLDGARYPLALLNELL